ncbi:MAG: CoxG family protein [Chloroflexota bacterium]
MKLDGTISIAADRSRVWDQIVDPVTLASCVPGVGGVRAVDDRTFEGAITIGIGPIDGSFTFTSVLTRTNAPDDLDVEVRGLDSVTKSRVEADVACSLADTPDGGTALAYRANLRVGGRLAIVGEMVLRATAGALIAQVTRCLRDRLEPPATVAEAAPRADRAAP